MQFSFRPIAEADLPMLHAWLQRPHVAQWWGEADPLDELREHYLTHAAEPRATRAYIASLEGRDVGFIQCYCVMGCEPEWWTDETDPGSRGIDQFLADEADLSRGVGRAMIRGFVQRLFADPEVTVVQTDPSPTNHRAIRCYAAAGFSAVGVVDTPDGPALLMRVRRPQPALQDMPDEDWFRALEVRRTQALVQRDVATIRELHAPDYELISVPGRVMSLERYLSLMAQDVFYADWQHGPMRVQRSPGMAAVRYQARITFPSGKVVECWHTDLYALRGGAWLAIWSQGTALPPAVPA